MDDDDWTLTRPIRVKRPNGQKWRPTQATTMPSTKLHQTRHVRITRLGIDHQGRRLVRLRFRIARRWVRTWVPLDMLMAKRTAVFEALHAAGLSLLCTAARNDLIKRIQAALPTLRATVVTTRLGWFGVNYVLPHVPGHDQEPQVNVWLGHLGPAQLGKYQASGCLDGAKEIMTLVRGDPRFMLAIALAFVGPVLPIMAVPSFAVNFVDRGDGTVAPMLAVASGMWGRHIDPVAADRYGFGEPWNGQPERLRQLMEDHRHTPLYLHPVKPVAIPRRMHIDQPTTGQPGIPPEPAVIVGSGLETSAAHAQAARTTLTNICPRVIDIPPPGTSSTVTQGPGDRTIIATFIASLGQLAAQHHGVAAREFARRLAELRVRREAFIRKFLNRRRKAFGAAVRRKDHARAADHPPTPAIDALAVTYAAVCLARRLGVVPWTRSELKAALASCYQDHVGYQATHSAAPVDPIALVRDYIRANQGGFQRLPVEPPHVGHTAPVACPGYRGIIAGREEFMLPTAAFDRLFASQADARAAKATLHQRGLLRATRSRCGRKRYVVKRLLGHDQSGRPRRSYVTAIDGNILSP